MSSVPSRSARRRARVAAASPAVAGFRPAGAALAVAAAFAVHSGSLQAQSVPIAAIHGSATYQRSGNNLLVTTTNGAGTNHSAINWQSFSVPGGSTTYFQQPSAASTSINRVLGSDPSAIFGTLGSNGKLVLVNPAGIAVGKGAVVDTAGFTASTLGMSDADAIAGRLAFSGAGPGVLQVDGHVIARGGDVVLIGSKVQAGSEAVVQADGAVVLAAGRKAEITGRGLEGIRLEVQAGNEAVNLGTLQGDAVGIFANTLTHSGLVQAQAVSTDGGKVVLKATGGDAIVSGTITAAAANGKGGSVDVFGQRVGLMAGAAIDASGAAGGGQVRIGGDYQGSNPDVPNALRTYVDAAATIKADATQQGDGGRVIVWADEVTRMHGQISARGGAAGGNGGFAEVSGKQSLEFTGRADLRAPAGHAGTLLLDPNDIKIVASGTTDVPNTPPPDVVFGGGPDVAEIVEADLEAQLAGSNVIIRTNINTSGTGGTITVASGVSVDWSRANTVLGLQADQAIDLQGNLRATGADSVISLQALGGNVTQASTSVLQADGLVVNAPVGSVTLDGANLVKTLAGNTGGGSFLFTNGQALTLGTVTSAYQSQRTGITASGDVRVKTTAGDITVALPPPAPTPPPVVRGQNVTLQAKGSINIQGSIEATAPSTGTVALQATTGNISQLSANSVITAQSLLASAAGAVSLTQANQVGVVAGSGSSFEFSGAQAFSVGSVSAPWGTQAGISAADVKLRSSGAVTVVAAVDVTTGNLEVEASALTVSGAGILRKSGSGDIQLKVDSLDLAGASGNAAQAAGRVVINPRTAAPIAILGSDATTLSTSGFRLSTPSLNKIQAQTLVIGNGGGTPITLYGTVDLLPGAAQELSLISAGAITQDTSMLPGGTLKARAVNLDGSTVTVGNAGNAVGKVSGRYDDGFRFHSDSNLVIGTVDGIAGVKKVSPTVSVPSLFIDSGGTLTGAADVTGVDVQLGGVGTVTLGNVTAQSLRLIGNSSVAGTVVQQQGGTLLDIGELNGQSNAPSGNAFNLTNAANKIAAASSLNVVGDVAITSSTAMSIGFVEAANVTLKAAGMSSQSESGIRATGALALIGTGTSSVDLGTTTVTAAGLTLGVGGSVDLSNSFNSLGYVSGTAGGAVTLRGLQGVAAAGLSTNGNIDLDSTPGVVAFVPSPGDLDLLGAVSAGGSVTLTSPGTIVVQSGASVSGTTLELNAPQTQVFGELKPGGGGIGSATVNGDLFIGGAGKVLLDVASPASFDTLTVTGAATTDSTTALWLLDGTSGSSTGSFTPTTLGAGSSLSFKLPASHWSVSATQPYVVTIGTAPAPAPVAPPPTDLQEKVAADQGLNQIATFASLFIQEAEAQQQQEAEEREIGKDDIVVTETACK